MPLTTRPPPRKKIYKNFKEFSDNGVKIGRLKIGNLNKFGKEVRIGRDENEFFQHIDIEGKANGKPFKNLKIKIMTNPLKL